MVFSPNKFKIINSYDAIYRIHKGRIKHISKCMIDNKLYTEVYFKNQPEIKIFVTDQKKVILHTIIALTQYTLMK